MSITQRLADLGLTLPQPPQAVGRYHPWVRTGHLIFVSGQFPLVNGVLKYAGKLAGLRQISSPNKAQSSFVSKEYVAIVVQPLHKTERHRCTKCL